MVMQRTVRMKSGEGLNQMRALNALRVRVLPWPKPTTGEWRPSAFQQTLHLDIE